MPSDDLSERFSCAQTRIPTIWLIAWRTASATACERLRPKIRSAACYRAVQDFDKLLKLMVRSEGVPLYGLFNRAITQVRSERPEAEIERSGPSLR